MGMRAHYLQLDSEDIDRILADRKAPGDMLMGAVTGGANMQDVFKVLGVKNSDLKALEKMIGPIPSSMKGSASAATQKKRPSMDIEKSWQAIHFVLHGDPWKGKGLLFNAVLGGTEVGEDLGYGRPRYVDPFKVVQTSTALDRLTDDDFRKKASTANFAGKDIYVYGNRLSESDLEELAHYFGQIRAFFRAAADKGNGVLLGII